MFTTAEYKTESKEAIYLASSSRDRAASRPHQQALTISSHTRWAPETETKSIKKFIQHLFHLNLISIAWEQSMPVYWMLFEKVINRYNSSYQKNSVYRLYRCSGISLFLFSSLFLLKCDLHYQILLIFHLPPQPHTQFILTRLWLPLLVRVSLSELRSCLLLHGKFSLNHGGNASDQV